MSRTASCLMEVQQGRWCCTELSRQARHQGTWGSCTTQWAIAVLPQGWTGEQLITASAIRVCLSNDVFRWSLGLTFCLFRLQESWRAAISQPLGTCFSLALVSVNICCHIAILCLQYAVQICPQNFRRNATGGQTGPSSNPVSQPCCHSIDNSQGKCVKKRSTIKWLTPDNEHLTMLRHFLTRQDHQV